MFTALLARFGINFSVKTLIYVLAILAVVGVIFAGYRHFENTQAALVAQAQRAATAQVVANVELQSQAIVKKQAQVESRSMDALSQSNMDAETEWNAILGSVDDIPQTQETLNAPSDNSRPDALAPDNSSAKPVSQTQVADPAIDVLNGAADRAYGLLERASDTSRR